MFTQRKQAECFKDKKKTVNGRNVVVKVDFAENCIDQCHWNQSQVTMFTVCA